METDQELPERKLSYDDVLAGTASRDPLTVEIAPGEDRMLSFTGNITTQPKLYTDKGRAHMKEYYFFELKDQLEDGKHKKWRCSNQSPVAAELVKLFKANKFDHTIHREGAEFKTRYSIVKPKETQ